MRQLPRLLAVCSLAVTPGLLSGPRSPFTGRWDLTLTDTDGKYPSWMEFTSKEGAPEVRVVGRVGSAHAAAAVKLDGERLSFTTSEWFGKQMPVTWELAVAGAKLSGTEKRSDGVEGRIEGVPAPALNRRPPGAWSNPQPLLDGKGLQGWEPDDPGSNHWKVENGELINEKAGANLRTTRRFRDFKLHVEYNCPQEGNSGIYLRGRYEVQVEYEPGAVEDRYHEMGSIYGFLPPRMELPRKPGQWESFDITLVGRRVTVVRDGVTTIDDKEIPGITGGAIDSDEGAPGPIYIQGDHTGGMKYRNITVAVPQG